MSITPQQENVYGIVAPEVPNTKYFLTTEQFDKAVGNHFIKHANRSLEKGKKFMVGLSHGQSPAGAYRYIFEHYSELKNPQNIYYTFVNSPSLRQHSIKGTMVAREFLKKLYRTNLISREQIIGYNFRHESMEQYVIDFNRTVSDFLQQNGKEGFDYVFLSCNPRGQVAAIERNSTAFDSKEIAVIVDSNNQKKITGTPYFLLRSKRIAFLATKADKRRPLAWLYATNARPNESPAFLRYLPNVQKKMTVFIDDKALTWPQLQISRPTPYGDSVIKVDTANEYDEKARVKKPVILLIHGFLGLNSYDALLSLLPSHLYIAAAMHYGTIPHDLPPSQYSQHVAANINAVVEYFGSKGHPVYIFDHSMGNIYFMMIDRELNKYPAIKKYLKGRIGGNPFFGEEAKHATLGFLDNVILPALSHIKGVTAKTMIVTLRGVIPFDTKAGVRKRGITLSNWLISKESSVRERIWSAAKERILYLMTNMDSLPHLNRVPIEKALNRLPAKVFAIQVFSALEQSTQFDKQIGLQNIPKQNIPVLILKTERDGVARFVPRIYSGKNIEVVDVTNQYETDLFREHLFHMAHPYRAVQIIVDFISRTEAERKAKLQAAKLAEKTVAEC